jgi:hypothetical protein
MGWKKAVSVGLMGEALTRFLLVSWAEGVAGRFRGLKADNNRKAANLRRNSARVVDGE